MANLNFQQPPRSIPNASLSGRNTGSFGNSTLSGHVTPPSGMFPPSSNFAQQQQQQQQPPQLSPNRSAQLSGIGGGSGGTLGGGLGIGPPHMSGSARQNLFGGQRAFTDRRSMPGIGGPMSNIGSFMQSRGYGSQGGNSINNYHPVFGSSTIDTVTPPLLDLNEFPSLTNARGQNDHSMQPSNPLQPPGSKPYVGMVKQPTTEQTEFTMSSEDFPALPGTQNNEGLTSSSVIGGLVAGNNQDQNDKGPAGAVGMGMDLQSDTMTGNDKAAMKRGVQTSPNGMVTNIPASMVNNQFGMVGLLTFIRAAETDPNLVSLAMGQDLTALGLNLNSLENLYPSFAGPFSDATARPQDIDYHVPPEYLINSSIRDKLAGLALKKYKDDLLFYLFYTNVGDFMQLAAAAELHNRDWRYHTEEKVWITRLPGMTQYEKNGTTERGTYYYFDTQNWRRVPKDFQVDTLKLDKCPNVGTMVSMSG